MNVIISEVAIKYLNNKKRSSGECVYVYVCINS